MIILLTNICGIFFKCSSLKEINLSSFKTDNKKFIYNIFKVINSNCYIICNDYRIMAKFKIQIKIVLYFKIFLIFKKIYHNQ